MSTQALKEFRAALQPGDKAMIGYVTSAGEFIGVDVVTVTSVDKEDARVAIEPGGLQHARYEIDRGNRRFSNDDFMVLGPFDPVLNQKRLDAQAEEAEIYELAVGIQQIQHFLNTLSWNLQTKKVSVKDAAAMIDKLSAVIRAKAE